MSTPDKGIHNLEDRPIVVRGYGVYFIEPSSSEIARKISLPDHMVLMVPADQRLGKHDSVLIDGFELPLMYVEADKFFELTRPLSEPTVAADVYEKLKTKNPVDGKPYSLKQLESLWESGELVKLAEAFGTFWSTQSKFIDLGIMYARAIASELSHVLEVPKKEIVQNLVENSTLTAEEIEFGTPNADRGADAGEGANPQIVEVYSEQFGLLNIQEHASIEIGSETVAADMWCLQSEHDEDDPASNFAFDTIQGNWKAFSIQVQDPEALATYFDDWDLDSGADPIIQYQLVLLVHENEAPNIERVLEALEEICTIDIDSGAVAFCDATLRDDEAFWEEWVANADEMNPIRDRSLSFSIGGDGEVPIFAAQNDLGKAYALAVPFWL